MICIENIDPEEADKYDVVDDYVADLYEEDYSGLGEASVSTGVTKSRKKDI